MAGAAAPMEARAALLRYCDRPGTEAFLKAMDLVHGLGPMARATLFADAEILSAISRRAEVLDAAAGVEGAPLAVLQEADHELVLLRDALATQIPADVERGLESAQKGVSQALSRRVSGLSLGEPDMTARFAEAMGDGGAGLMTDDQVRRLRRHHVIFVPGLGSDVYLKLGMEYFDDQLRLLRGLGVSNQRSAINGERRIRRNEPVLAREIRASDKPVLIVSHSMGCLDTLKTLLACLELQEKVAGWIAIQGPFMGAPVADLVAARPLLRWPLKWLLNAFGGGFGAITELETRAGRRFLLENASAIKDLTAKIPVISVATRKDPVRGRPIDTMLMLTRNWMWRRAGPNDGLVPTASALLPHSRVVNAEGIDHQVTVMPSWALALDRARFLKALLGLWLTL